MDQAQLLQEPVLQIPLDGVKLYHRVGNGGAGGKYHAAPTGQLVQVLTLHKEVGTFLSLGLGNAAHIPHFCRQKQVLKIMALINEKPVHAELLKGDHIILAALVVELGKPCLQGFPGALHLLDRVAFRLLRLGLLDPFQDFLDLAFQNGLLALHTHGDFLKLRMSDDDGVIVPGGNAAAKLLPVLGFKIFLCRYQDVGRRIELEPFRRPLLGDVVRHHNQRLGAKAQALHLHSGGHHLVGFASPYFVGQQRVPTIQNVRDGVDLMGP